MIHEAPESLRLEEPGDVPMVLRERPVSYGAAERGGEIQVEADFVSVLPGQFGRPFRVVHEYHGADSRNLAPPDAL